MLSQTTASSKDRVALCIAGPANTLYLPEVYLTYQRAILEGYQSQNIHTDLFMALHFEETVQGIATAPPMGWSEELYARAITKLQPTSIDWISNDSNEAGKPINSLCSIPPEYCPDENYQLFDKAWSSCYDQIVSQEAKSGKKYTRLLLSRPDTVFVGNIEPLSDLPTDNILVSPNYLHSHEVPNTWKDSLLDDSWTYKAFGGNLNTLDVHQLRIAKEAVFETNSTFSLNLVGLLAPRAAAQSLLKPTSQDEKILQECSAAPNLDAKCNCRIQSRLREIHNVASTVAWPQIMKTRRPTVLCHNGYNPTWNGEQSQQSIINTRLLQMPNRFLLILSSMHSYL